MYVKSLLFSFLWIFLSSELLLAQNWIQEYDSFYNQGLVLNEESNWEQAVYFFDEAYTLAQTNNDILLSLKAGIRKADGLISSDELTEARSLLRSLEEITNKNTPTNLHSELIFLLGSATYRLGDFEMAAKQYERGLTVANPSSDSLIIAKLSLYLANVLIITTEYERGHELASRAILILKQLGNDYYLSRANLFKYIIYLYQGNLEEGEPYLKQSYNYAQLTNDPSLLRDSYLYLSDFYERKNDPSLSITFSEKGLALAEESQQNIYIERFFNRLGTLYLELNDPKRALSYFNRAYKYYKSIGNEVLATDRLLKVAECYIRNEDYDEAGKILLEALDFYNTKNQHFDRAFTINALAGLKLKTKNFSEAQNYLEENLKNSNEHGLIRVKRWTLEKLLHLPDSYFSKQEKLSASRELYVSALTLEPEIQVRALKNYSYSFLEVNSDSAFHYADEALKLIEKKRFSFSDGTLKASIFAAHATYYNDVASWHADFEQDYSKAFELFESSKSRALLDQLAESRSEDLLALSEETEMLLLQLQKKIDQLYRQREAASREEAIRLTHEITDAELEYEASIEQVRRDHPAWNSFVYPETLSLKEVQQLCDGKTGILEYAFLKEGLAIMLITKNDVAYHKIDADIYFKEEFTEGVNLFRDAVIRLAPKDTLEELSKPLYKQLFAPFEEELEDLTQLVIVPDGSISLLPFDALVQSGDFLLRHFAIKYLPSVSVFKLLQSPHRTTSQELLAIAGSGFESGKTYLGSSTQNDFAALPFTLIEVDSVSARFERTKVLKNELVSEAGVKNLSLGSFKYLHFATHGDINEITPSQSGLILSKKTEMERLFGEDGYLNAKEISGLKLNADMVVLSACNTATGKVLNGEGLLGLQRSFFVAGASSVVASLWSIYDRSTPLIMTAFYTNLLEYEDKEFGWFDKLLVWGDWYKPELIDYKTLALRDAKLEMLEHPYYSHPVHWASFTITGK